jgi:hypothetical protein
LQSAVTDMQPHQNFLLVDPNFFRFFIFHCKIFLKPRPNIDRGGSAPLWQKKRVIIEILVSFFIAVSLYRSNMQSFFTSISEPPKDFFKIFFKQNQMNAT